MAKLIGAARPSVPGAVTAGRWTHVRLNVPDPVLIEGSFWATRFHDQVGRTTGSENLNVVHSPGVGWELREYQLDSGIAQERTVAVDGILKPTGDGGSLQVPAGVLARNVQRKATELTGAFDGGASDAATTGMPMLAKEVDTESWADAKYRLQSHMTADPNPIGASERTSPLDRIVRDSRGVGVGTFTRDKNDVEDGTVTFTMMLPGSTALPIDTVGTIAFTAAPAVMLVRASNGQLTGFKGTGEYLLEFAGSGALYLWDRVQNIISGAPSGTPRWRRHLSSWRWASERHALGFQAHTIRIRRVRYGTADRREVRNGYVGSILVTVSAPGPASPLSGSVGNSGGSPTSGQSMKYFIPFTGDPEDQPPVSTAPPYQVDVSRAQRPMIQISEARYPATGTLYDDWISLDGYSFAPGVSGHRLVRVTVTGVIPPGCGFDLAMEAREASGSSLVTACAADGAITSGPGWVSRVFRLPTDRSVNTFRAKVTFQASDHVNPSNPQKRTPILERVTYAKDAIGLVLADGEIDLVGKQTGVSVTGVDRDPTTATASVKIDDLTNAHAILREQGTFPCSIDTEHDMAALGGSPVDWATDANAKHKRSVLFRGYVDKIDATRTGAAPSALGSAVDAVFPSAERRKYDLTILGMWARAQEATAPFSANWTSGDPSDPDPSKPWRVLSVLRVLFSWMGFPDSMIAIPVPSEAPGGLGDIRMQPRPGEQDASLSAGASILEYAQEIAKSYLARSIDFCPNSVGWGFRTALTSTPEQWYGAWVLIGQPAKVAGDYLPLARFFRRPPANAGAGVPDQPRLMTPMRAYFTPNGAFPGGEVPGAPILRGTFRSRVRRPEANMITVAGTSDGGVFVSDNSGQVFAATMINFASYNAYPGVTTAVPGTVDYIGRRIPRRYVLEGLIASSEMAQWICRQVYRWIGQGTKEVTWASPLVLVWDPNDPCQVRPRPLRYYDPVEVDGVKMLMRGGPAITISRDVAQMAMYEAEVPRS